MCNGPSVGTQPGEGSRTNWARRADSKVESSMSHYVCQSDCIACTITISISVIQFFLLLFKQVNCFCFTRVPLHALKTKPIMHCHSMTAQAKPHEASQASNPRLIVQQRDNHYRRDTCTFLLVSQYMQGKEKRKIIMFQKLPEHRGNLKNC